MSKGFVLPSLGMSALVLGMLTIAGLSLTVYVYSLRLEACEAKYDKFVHETRRVGEEQKAKTEATNARQDKTFTDLKHRYDDAVKRMQRGTGSGVVSRSTESTASSDGASEEFTANCTADALTLAFLQQWVREQGFPVE